MIHDCNFCNQPVKKEIKTYDNIRKKVTGQGHDYTTSSLLDYPYLREKYKLIEIDSN